MILSLSSKLNLSVLFSILSIFDTICENKVLVKRKSVNKLKKLSKHALNTIVETPYRNNIFLPSNYPSATFSSSILSTDLPKNKKILKSVKFLNFLNYKIPSKIKNKYSKSVKKCFNPLIDEKKLYLSSRKQIAVIHNKKGLIGHIKHKRTIKRDSADLQDNFLLPIEIENEESEDSSLKSFDSKALKNLIMKCLFEFTIDDLLNSNIIYLILGASLIIICYKFLTMFKSSDKSTEDCLNEDFY